MQVLCHAMQLSLVAFMAQACFGMSMQQERLVQQLALVVSFAESA